MDEPEALGAIGLAAREELDNLTFVINCNLQRLDGPVRGNGKIIQELEASSRRRWNVIKVIWGRDWDPLLAQDTDGVLVNKMNTTPDGQFQTYSVESGAYIRENFFGGDPRLRKIVEHLSDDELRGLSLRRARLPQGVRGVQGGAGAHRPAHGHPGAHHQGLDAGQGLRGAQRHPPDEEAHRGRAQGVQGPDPPIGDSALEAELAACTTTRGEDLDEIQYMRERRAALGGVLPRRVIRAKSLPQPPDTVYEELRKGSGKQAVATTMAFVLKLLKELMKDPAIRDGSAPIIPDEARTFGMDSLFPTAKIYSPSGQSYDAVDRNLLLSDKESETGQILHEGISESGAMGSVIAAGSSYATHGTHMIPVYVFYDVRLAVHRGPDVGARRPARAGFPARRDGLLYHLGR